MTASINRHNYQEARAELSDMMDHMFTTFESVAKFFPFVALSGVLFLSQVAYYTYESVQFQNHQPGSFILLSGVGCMCAAAVLIMPFSYLRTLQAVAAFMGNATIMITMSGI